MNSQVWTQKSNHVLISTPFFFQIRYPPQTLQVHSFCRRQLKIYCLSIILVYNPLLSNSILSKPICTNEELAPMSLSVPAPQPTNAPPRFRPAGRAAASKVRTPVTAGERLFHDGLTAGDQIGSPSGFSVTVEGKPNKKHQIILKRTCGSVMSFTTYVEYQNYANLHCLHHFTNLK